MRKLCFVLVIFLAACSTKSITPPLQSCPPAIDLSGNWFNCGKTLQLRHAGAITIGDTTIPISGLMELDTEHGSAKVVILTRFGIKLVSLVVNRDSVHVLTTSPIAHQIPHFIDECSHSIRRMFLTDFPNAKDTCVQGKTELQLNGPRHKGILRSFVDQPSGFVRKKHFVSAGENWTVHYDDTITVNGISLPVKTSFFSRDRHYSIILQLQSSGQS